MEFILLNILINNVIILLITEQKFEMQILTAANKIYLHSLASAAYVFLILLLNYIAF